MILSIPHGPVYDSSCMWLGVTLYFRIGVKTTPRVREDSQRLSRRLAVSAPQLIKRIQGELFEGCWLMGRLAAAYWGWQNDAAIVILGMTICSYQCAEGNRDRFFCQNLLSRDLST
jgi:hypothetical protein